MGRGRLPERSGISRRHFLNRATRALVGGSVFAAVGAGALQRVAAARRATHPGFPGALLRPPVRRTLIGQSVEGRELEVWRIGRGPNHVFIMGGVHTGQESASADLAVDLAAYYRRNPRRVPASITLHVVPNANPDGYTAGRRNNANDVTSTATGRRRAGEPTPATPVRWSWAGRRPSPSLRPTPSTPTCARSCPRCRSRTTRADPSWKTTTSASPTCTLPSTPTLPATSTCPNTATSNASQLRVPLRPHRPMAQRHARSAFARLRRRAIRFSGQRFRSKPGSAQRHACPRRCQDQLSRRARAGLIRCRRTQQNYRATMPSSTTGIAWNPYGIARIVAGRPCSRSTCAASSATVAPMSSHGINCDARTAVASNDE